MRYDLSFDIPPDLYRRAVTVPVGRAMPSKKTVVLRNVLAAILAPAAIVCFALAVFDADAIAPVAFGAAIGAFFVMAIWWRQHQGLMRHHSQFNDTGGQQDLQIDATGIIARRPNVTSTIKWPFVTDVRSFEGATLIELPTARLIVPDAALPGGDQPEAFRAQLSQWRSA